MSTKDPYLYNINKDVHLRDARHAHQLYTDHNMALAPKTKFLYHVVFETYNEVGNSATNNTVNFSKENSNLKILGGIMGEDILDVAGVKNVATLPSL